MIGSFATWIRGQGRNGFGEQTASEFDFRDGFKVGALVAEPHGVGVISACVSQVQGVSDIVAWNGKLNIAIGTVLNRLELDRIR